MTSPTPTLTDEQIDAVLWARPMPPAAPDARRAWYRDFARAILAAAPTAPPDGRAGMRVGDEARAFNEWWESSGQGSDPLHTLITKNAAHATWQERASRASPASSVGGVGNQISGSKNSSNSFDAAPVGSCRAVMQQALDAMLNASDSGFLAVYAAIRAIDAYLAAPAQEGDTYSAADVTAAHTAGYQLGMAQQSAPAAVQAPTGLTQSLAKSLEAIEQDHDPLCMAVLRGKACTCGAASGAVVQGNAPMPGVPLADIATPRDRLRFAATQARLRSLEQDWLLQGVGPDGRRRLLQEHGLAPR